MVCSRIAESPRREAPNTAESRSARPDSAIRRDSTSYGRTDASGRTRIVLGRCGPAEAGAAPGPDGAGAGVETSGGRSRRKPDLQTSLTRHADCYDWSCHDP